MAISLDSNNAAVLMPSWGSLTASDKITLSCWFNASSIANNPTIWSWRIGGSGWWLRCSANGNGRPGWNWWTTGGISQSYGNGSGAQFSTGVWNFIAVAFDWASPGSVVYYSNLEKQSRSRNAGTGTTPVGTGADVMLGKYGTNSDPLSGAVAFPGMWDRVLSDEEILSLASGIHPRHIPRGLRYCPDLDRMVDTVSGAALSTAGTTSLVPNPRIYA